MQCPASRRESTPVRLELPGLRLRPSAEGGIDPHAPGTAGGHPRTIGSEELEPTGSRGGRRLSTIRAFMHRQTDVRFIAVCHHDRVRQANDSRRIGGRRR